MHSEEARTSEQPSERWYRLILRRGGQSCTMLALGISEEDAARTVRDEIPLYDTHIALVDGARSVGRFDLRRGPR